QRRRDGRRWSVPIRPRPRDRSRHRSRPRRRPRVVERTRRRRDRDAGGSLIADRLTLRAAGEQHPTMATARLTRSETDRKIGGVAGGFAAYLGLDPTLVRLAWVIAIFFGFGIPAYVILWI